MAPSLFAAVCCDFCVVDCLIRKKHQRRNFALHPQLTHIAAESLGTVRHLYFFASSSPWIDGDKSMSFKNSPRNIISLYLQCWTARPKTIIRHLSWDLGGGASQHGRSVGGSGHDMVADDWLRRRTVERPLHSTLRPQRPWSASTTFDRCTVAHRVETLTLPTIRVHTSDSDDHSVDIRVFWSSGGLGVRPLRSTMRPQGLGVRPVNKMPLWTFDHCRSRGKNATSDVRPLQGRKSKCHLGRSTTAGSCFLLRFDHAP